MTFSDEYREYLENLALVALAGRELTGISDYDRVNVISVTEHMKALNQDIPDDYYVVEEAYIDGIVIWQDQAGAVYQSAPNAEIQKVADSLAEYYFPDNTKDY